MFAFYLVAVGFTLTVIGVFVEAVWHMCRKTKRK
jgi:hypothetical protein